MIFPWYSTTFSARNENISVFFPAIIYRTLPVRGGGVPEAVTLRLAPIPLLDLVSAFKLQYLQTSKTISVLKYVGAYDWIFEANSLLACSSNVLDVQGGVAFTKADPSVIITSTLGSTCGSVALRNFQELEQAGRLLT